MSFHQGWLEWGLRGCKGKNQEKEADFTSDSEGLRSGGNRGYQGAAAPFGVCGDRKSPPVRAPAPLKSFFK